MKSKERVEKLELMRAANGQGRERKTPEGVRREQEPEGRATGEKDYTTENLGNEIQIILFFGLLIEELEGEN